jgi:hypothetical protein
VFRAVRALCEEAERAGDADADAALVTALGGAASVLAADAAAAAALLSSAGAGGSEGPRLLAAWAACGARSSEVARLACFGGLARVLHAAPQAVALLPPAERGDAAAPFARYEAIFARLGGAGGAGGAGSGGGTNAAAGSGGADAGGARGAGLGAACALLLRTLRGGHGAPRARLAALDLLAGVVALPGAAGLRAVFGCAGMEEFLADRDSEVDKAGREFKHGVVVGALRNEAAAAALGADLLQRLRRERERGPYVANMAGPAVETAVRAEL